MMETKNSEVYCERIRKKLRMDKACYVNPEGTAGGLALWWTKETEVTVHEKDGFMIDTTIKLHNKTGRMHITWLYGSTDWGERLNLWDKLTHIARRRKEPWMCVGDFNEIAMASEKQGADRNNHGRWRRSMQ